MLGVGTYQEVLRSIGGMLDREHALGWPPGDQGGTPAGLPASGLASRVVLAEDAAGGAVSLAAAGRLRRLNAATVEAMVLASRARRGAGGLGGGPRTDVLRAAGFALDQLGATDVRIALRPSKLTVRFREEPGGPHRQVVYAGDDLAALRIAAAGRRKGDALRRIVILHESAATPLREQLAAEYAVEGAPCSYAPAVVAADDAPDLAIVYVAGEGERAQWVQAGRMIRRSPRRREVPLLLVTAPGVHVRPDDRQAAGVDDVLSEPFAPALLRARIRTWLLRGRSAGVDDDDTAGEAPVLPPGPVLADHPTLALSGTRTATVLLTDVRGFTGLAEGFADDPARLLGVINAHLAVVARAIAGCGGVVEKFLGDGVFATFGAREDLPNHRERALAAALEVVQSNEELNRLNAERWGFRLDVSVAAAAGQVVVGRIGPPECAEFGVFGDPVNVAARLVSQGRAGEVLVSAAAYPDHGSALEGATLGQAAVPERLAGVEVYRLRPGSASSGAYGPDAVA